MAMTVHGGSAITRMFEAAKSGGVVHARSAIVATGHTLRQGGESVLVGGLLAAASVENAENGGLDHKMGTNVVPIDGVVAALGLIGGVAMSHEEYGPDLRNAGSAAAAIFAFRKGSELYAKKRGKTVPALNAHGEDDYGVDDVGVDPIVALAKRL